MISSRQLNAMSISGKEKPSFFLNIITPLSDLKGQLILGPTTCKIDAAESIGISIWIEGDVVQRAGFDFETFLEFSIEYRFIQDIFRDIGSILGIKGDADGNLVAERIALNVREVGLKL